MEDFLKKGTIVNLISTLLFLVVGIILVTNPVITLNVVTYVVETILIVWGIITIINYVRVESRHDVFSLGFVQGVVCILLALFLIVNPNILIIILPVCIGIWMVFGSLSRIQIAIKLNAWGQRTSGWYIFLAVLMFAIGLVIICNPFKTATIIVQALGIGIIAYSVLDIIEAVGVLRFLNKIDV
ncbi:MAG: DUF308 domain-containing protein [Clostridia bacterium]|nr:DUF308 domain-containing protein [Clostridia bacterium]